MPTPPRWRRVLALAITGLLGGQMQVLLARRWAATSRYSSSMCRAYSRLRGYPAASARGRCSAPRARRRFRVLDLEPSRDVAPE
jgi:hypothetical protein